MVVDVFGNLGPKQPDVQRRNDGTDPRAGEDGLDDGVFVPEHRGHHVALADAGSYHSAGELGDTRIQFAIGKPALAQQVINRNPVGVELSAAAHHPGDVRKLSFRVSEIFFHGGQVSGPVRWKVG